jgi:E3 ubiquitin-protein ligase DOA10
VSGDAVHQPTWPLLLKIEHMVKLQVLGNNSKTVNNIKNLTWGKNDQHIKIYLPCNFEVNLITHLGVIALFSSNLKLDTLVMIQTKFGFHWSSTFRGEDF